MNTRLRPTPYRDCHVGHALCAYYNWSAAKRSGGDFVLIIDDTDGWLGGCLVTGTFTLQHQEDRWVEDLTWLGMKPDRVVWAQRDNGHRHPLIEEKLGIRKPQMLHHFSNVLWESSTGRVLSLLEGDYDNEIAETWVNPYEGSAYNPWFVASVVLDDCDFGVNAWWCGVDWIQNACLYHHLGRQLGLNPPEGHWHPVVRYAKAHEKVSKSAVPNTSVRMLKEAGYKPEAIIETLLECRRRSYEAGYETITIPAGVLSPERVKTLRWRHISAERMAKGLMYPNDPWNEDAAQHAGELLRRARRGTAVAAA